MALTLPNLDNALSLFDPTTAFGLAVVGAIFGCTAVPLAWPRRHDLGDGYPTVTASVLMVLMFSAYFVFLIVFRYLTGPAPIAERTIGTGLLGLVFAGAASAGLAVRSRR